MAILSELPAEDTVNSSRMESIKGLARNLRVAVLFEAQEEINQVY